LLGTQGLKKVAQLCMDKTRYAKDRVKAIPGVEVMETNPVFNEFTVRLPMDAGEFAGMMVERGIAPGLPLGRFYQGMDNYLLIALTEKRTKYEIGNFAETMERLLQNRSREVTV
jgi:glycine dehydrogenase subunit 1